MWNKDLLENKLKRLGRETKVYAVDSKAWNVAANDYLPEGTVSAFRGKFQSLILGEEMQQGKLGNWIAIPISHKGKKIVIENVHRLPVTSMQGLKCYLTQCNAMEGSAKGASEHRKEILA